MLGWSRYEKRIKQIFFTRSEKWSENWSLRFECKILLISFSRGAGPPVRVDLSPRISKICVSWTSVWNISANYVLVFIVEYRNHVRLITFHWQSESKWGRLVWESKNRYSRKMCSTLANCTTIQRTPSQGIVSRDFPIFKGINKFYYRQCINTHLTAEPI